MAQESIDFDDLERIEVPVKYGGKKYLLRECPEFGAVKMRAAAARSTRTDANGKPVDPDGGGGFAALLVSFCLCETVGEGDQLAVKQGEDGRAVTVPLATIDGWPSHIVATLFDKARVISQLVPDSEEALLKQIASLQEQLEAVRAKNAAGAPTQKTSA